MVLDARKSGLRVRPEVLSADRGKYIGFTDWWAHKKGKADLDGLPLKREKRLGTFIVR